jgi:hypothetical protein
MLRIASHHVNDCSRNRASIIVQKLGSMAYVMPPPRPDESAARAGSDQLKWRSVPPLEVKFHGCALGRERHESDQHLERRRDGHFSPIECGCL